MRDAIRYLKTLGNDTKFENVSPPFSVNVWIGKMEKDVCPKIESFLCSFVPNVLKLFLGLCPMKKGEGQGGKGGRGERGRKGKEGGGRGGGEKKTEGGGFFSSLTSSLSSSFSSQQQPPPPTRSHAHPPTSPPTPPRSPPSPPLSLLCFVSYYFLFRFLNSFSFWKSIFPTPLPFLLPPRALSHISHHPSFSSFSPFFEKWKIFLMEWKKEEEEGGRGKEWRDLKREIVGSLFGEGVERDFYERF